MYMHSVSLCTHLFWVSGVSRREQSYIISLYHYGIHTVCLSLRQIDRQTDIQTDRQTYQREFLSHTHTYTHIDTHTHTHTHTHYIYIYIYIYIC